MRNAERVHDLISATRELSRKVSRLNFGPPVAHVYNPLDYAWGAHEQYLRRFGRGPKKVVFLGMNPGPWGMVQTGIPFGEVSVVRDWMGIHEGIQPPARQHPRRPIFGFDCQRSEISGQRLWKLFSERFGAAEIFFRDHFVVNYCPLAFLEAGGCNRTPDKLPAPQTAPLYEACDEHLRRTLEVLQPRWAIGIGGFAAKRLLGIASDLPLQIGQILHPSPASPAANRGWAALAAGQLTDLGVWK